MAFILNFFNNREKALIIWIVIGTVIVLANKAFRPSALAVLKAFFARKIVTVLLIMLTYIALVVFVAYRVHLWNVLLLKDTIVWVVGTAFIMFANYERVANESHFFKNVLLDNVKLAVFVQFIINWYVFNLVVELILVPILFFLAAMLAFASTKKEYKPVTNLMQFLLATYGIFLLIYALVQMVYNFNNFATLYTLKDFLLSPLLTLSFLPFVYFLALYATYEALFTRMDIFMGNRNKELTWFAKRQILRTCLLNVKKLNRFATNYTSKLYAVGDKSDVVSLMNQFRVSSRS